MGANNEIKTEAGAEAGQQFHLGIRLQPIENSDQPVFANFSFVQGAQGMLFLDFGFLEPRVLPSVMKLAREGGKLPETVNGKLAARVVLSPDAANQLLQQLEQQVRGVKPQQARPGMIPELAAH